MRILPPRALLLFVLPAILVACDSPRPGAPPLGGDAGLPPDAASPVDDGGALPDGGGLVVTPACRPGVVEIASNGGAPRVDVHGLALSGHEGRWVVLYEIGGEHTLAVVAGDGSVRAQEALGRDLYAAYTEVRILPLGDDLVVIGRASAQRIATDAAGALSLYERVAVGLEPSSAFADGPSLWAVTAEAYAEREFAEIAIDDRETRTGLAVRTRPIAVPRSTSAHFAASPTGVVALLDGDTYTVPWRIVEINVASGSTVASDVVWRDGPNGISFVGWDRHEGRWLVLGTRRIWTEESERHVPRFFAISGGTTAPVGPELTSEEAGIGAGPIAVDGSHVALLLRDLEGLRFLVGPAPDALGRGTPLDASLYAATAFGAWSPLGTSGAFGALFTLGPSATGAPTELRLGLSCLGG